MTIKNVTDTELRLQAEIAALKKCLFEMQNAAIDLSKKLAEYESREPVAILHDDGYWTWIGTPPYKSSFAGWRMNVYKGTP